MTYLRNMLHVSLVPVFVVLHCMLPASEARGLLLLYRPLDVTTECAVSEYLRYDLSFGMGMSDTITLIFRTLNEVDYECGIDIATDKNFYLIIVIKFPNGLGYNCEHNPHAFSVLKKDKCFELCGTVNYKVTTPYFALAPKSRFRFRFLSNSSVNLDMQAHLYAVTATAARHLSSTRNGSCESANETLCQIDSELFCFTSGVVCDGIMNCGVNDWFDERTADCDLPVQSIGKSPLIAVAAALVCALIAAVHITIKCIPPAAHSFFILNINEDNRLFIEPVFRYKSGPPPKVEGTKKHSLVPVDCSSSSTTEDNGNTEQNVSTSDENPPFPKRKSTMKTVTKKIQEKIKIVATRNKNTTDPENVPKTSPHSRGKSFIV